MNLSSKMRSSPKEAMASLLAEEMASCMSHSKSLVVVRNGCGEGGNQYLEQRGRERASEGPEVTERGDRS